ncbi:MAG: alpha/beta hydrolase [Gammaproteobacteria bacterium]
MHCSFFILSLLLLLAGCAGTSVESRWEIARALAKAGAFTYSEIATTTFTFATYGRIGFSEEVTVYIEGDGFAYSTLSEISTNPTPLNPTGLKLATLDGGESVIYLARPCQYVDLEAERFCSNKYWSSHRFSEEVISAYEQALDKIKNIVGATSFHLVGYSGGGAVAVLIAANRADIVSVRTVAGYLDHVALNERMGVSALTGSLDPMRVAMALKGIPQIHYAGANDKVIPPWVVEKFVAAVDDPKCVRFLSLDRVGHERGWSKHWEKLGYIEPTC